MATTANPEAAIWRPQVVLLVCSRVIGGHEFQAAALARDLAAQVSLTVVVNSSQQLALFADSGASVRLAEDGLLRPGPLPVQGLDGLRRRAALRALVAGADEVIVSAGAVEAGVAAGVALRGQVPLSLYLPFFYDRRPVWGRWRGGLYNSALAACCRLFARIITINRIQARVIHGLTGVPTLVVPNAIRPVAAPTACGPGRLVFIGRLDQQKRVEELLRWLDFQDNPFREVLVIGDGPLRDTVLTTARGLQHVRAELLGWLDAPRQDALLTRDDILLLNSLLEGEPLVIREAQRRGMRVLARNITGVRGLTRRAERFDDARQLRQRLLALDAPATQAAAPGRADADTDAGRRARAIARWVRTLGPQRRAAQ